MPMATPDGMKVCSKCMENKSVGEFNRHRGEPDGLKLHCMVCIKQETRMYYLRNREKLINKSRVWAEENRDKTREANRRSYAKYKEERLAKANAWKQNNKDKNKASVLAWRAANPDRVKIQNRKVREKLTDGVVASMLGFRTGNIPPGLIETKRLQIQIKREIKQQEQAK